MLTAQARKCIGCGDSLNLTASGACKSCGTEYDVADFDWKIAYVDANAFV
jgi:rRNA maturation endonuclease Nob1